MQLLVEVVGLQRVEVPKAEVARIRMQEDSSAGVVGMGSLGYNQALLAVVEVDNGQVPFDVPAVVGAGVLGAGAVGVVVDAGGAGGAGAVGAADGALADADAWADEAVAADVVGKFGDSYQTLVEVEWAVVEGFWALHCHNQGGCSAYVPYCVTLGSGKRSCAADGVAVLH